MTRSGSPHIFINRRIGLIIIFHLREMDKIAAEVSMEKGILLPKLEKKEKYSIS